MLSTYTDLKFFYHSIAPDGLLLCLCYHGGQAKGSPNQFDNVYYCYCSQGVLFKLCCYTSTGKEYFLKQFSTIKQIVSRE